MDITNLTSEKIDKVFLKKVVQQTLKFLGREKSNEISLVLVSENKIREINQKYRHKNQPTDALSFLGLNEIFICPGVIKKQARNLKIPFKNELTRVLIHGILHLAGYEHEKGKKQFKTMRVLEDKIVRMVSK